MLDQNTDRMWYVIGAIIVGAAIIFLANSSFPQVFASVGTTFEDKVEDVTYRIDQGHAKLTTDGVNRYSKSESLGDVTLYWNGGQEHSSDPYWSEGDITTNYIAVSPGEQYVVTIDDMSPKEVQNHLRGGFYYTASKKYIGAEYSQLSSRLHVVPTDYIYEFVDGGASGEPVYMRLVFDKILTKTGKSIEELDIRIEKVIK